VILFTWILVVSSLQTEQIFDVFLSAFLPQGRCNYEQLSDYFDHKIKPRLKEGHLTNLVYDKEKLVGFAIFQKWEEHTYYLAEMAILPEYQRKGIGKQLVFSIFEHDESANKILLITEEKNQWSQSFYEKIGFKRSSFQHPNYPENFIGFEYYSER